MTSNEAPDPAPSEDRLLSRADVGPIAALFTLSFLLFVCVAILGARAAGIPLSHLGVHYDGILYIEIAKSFPLPYPPGAFDYAGQAPAYPALIYLQRLFCPPGMVNWAVLALVATWLPAAGCTVAFYLLCKQASERPFWPALLFLLANPRWVKVSAASHPEPLAVLLAIACLIAYLRKRLGWCVLLLSLATLARFPAILLGLPIAFGTLVLRRDLRIRSICLLAAPLAAFVLFNFYLRLRIPDFPGVFEAHQVFWKTELTWPFLQLYRSASPYAWGRGVPIFEITYISLLIYLLCVPLGFLTRDKHLWVLPVWVVAIVVPHASLSGVLGAWDFTRLAILAWPACLLILWRSIGTRLPAAAVVGIALGLGSFSVWFVPQMIARAVDFQSGARPLFERTIRRLSSDEPVWFNFRGLMQKREEQRRTPQRGPGRRP